MKTGTVVNLLGHAPDEIIADVRAAAGAVVWPPNSRIFALPPHMKIGRRTFKHLNGVGEIKNQFRANIISRGWKAEYPYRELGFEKGPFDAMHVATMTGAEWETGNISSSHRSMNKLAGALVAGHIRGAVLVLPDRELYPYLTDRVGNVGELEKYLDYWQQHARQVPRSAFMSILPVSYDEIRQGVQQIPKANDGNARMTHQVFVVDLVAGKRRFRVRVSAADESDAELFAADEVRRRYGFSEIPVTLAVDPRELWARQPLVDEVVEIT